MDGRAIPLLAVVLATAAIQVRAIILTRLDAEVVATRLAVPIREEEAVTSHALTASGDVAEGGFTPATASILLVIEGVVDTAGTPLLVQGVPLHVDAVATTGVEGVIPSLLDILGPLLADLVVATSGGEGGDVNGVIIVDLMLVDLEARAIIASRIGPCREPLTLAKGVEDHGLRITLGA